MNPMVDDVLLKKLLRQIRILNFVVIFFSFIFITLFAVAGVFAYHALGEIRDAKNSLSNVQQQAKDTLNVQDDLCGDSGSLSSLLKSQSGICN